MEFGGHSENAFHTVANVAEKDTIASSNDTFLQC
jgi:hypothetical protein